MDSEAGNAQGVGEACPFAGWQHWRIAHDGGFAGLLGDIFCLPPGQPGGDVRVAIVPTPRHANKLGNLHGGFVMAFVDVALFAVLSGGDAAGSPAVTVQCTTDFLAAGQVGVPLEARGRVVRGSGRLAFVEGMLWQQNMAVARWNGIMRRIRVPA